MRQTRARILSLLLALTMCLSLLPGTALAADPTDSPNGPVTEDEQDNNRGHIVQFFTNGGSITEIDGYGRDQLMSSYDFLDVHGVGIELTTKAGMIYTDSDGRLPCLPSAEREFYTFDGWYIVPTDRVPPSADGEGVFLYEFDHYPKATLSAVYTEDVCCVANWIYAGEPEQSKSREVWFNPNGGTAEKPSGYEYFDEDWDGATLMAMTDDDGKLPVLPTANREDYTFDGWYTAKTGGTKASADMDLSSYQGNGGNDNWAADQIVLWARWTQVKAVFHTVTFNWNGAMISGADPITVEHGKSLHASYSYDGLYAGTYTFKGWAMEDGTVYDGQPVMADMTLYAIWDPELKGIDPAVEDTYQFSNSSSAFSNYTVSESYLKLLLRGETAPWQEYIRDFMNSTWRGSCFGMSAVYAMSQGGQINLGRYQSGAARLWDLDKPKDNTGVRDLINYYLLSQLTTPADNYMRSYLRLDVSSRYQQIVQDLQDEKDFSVLGFNFGANNGHAIVAKSIAKGSDGNYHVSIWDPNYPMGAGELIISGNYSRAYFSNFTFDSASYNINTELKFIMPLSTKNQSYDARSITGVGTAGTASRMAILALDTGSFTLATEDGRGATVVNGRQTGGELNLIPIAIATGENDGYQFYLDEDELKDLTISISDGARQVKLISNDILARVVASGLKSVTVGEGSVSTVTDAAVQQKITLISDELGGYWDKVVASGKDTAISLKAEAGKLTVSAANSAAVTVQRENVVEQTSGDKEIVNATPDGVTISVSGMGEDPATDPSDEPITNPFTDVYSSDYYYDAVLWAVEKGVTAGATDTTFNPSGPCTRAQIVTFLWRAYGKQQATTAENPFTDVKPDDYYYDAVLWAVENGITAGATATTFDPNGACTRSQAVSFQWRAAGKPAVSVENPFTDVKSGDYYYDAVLWAVENGITAGATTTTFDPNGTCTRGQIVSFLYREMGK